MYTNTPVDVTQLKQEEIDKAISTIINSGVNTLEEFIVAANFAIAPYINLGNDKNFEYNKFKIDKDYFPSTAKTNSLIQTIELDYKVVFKYIAFFEKELNKLFSDHNPQTASISQLIQFLKDKIDLLLLELENSGDVEIIKETFKTADNFDFTTDPTTGVQRTTANISGGLAHLAANTTTTTLCTYDSVVLGTPLDDVISLGKKAHFGIGKKYGVLAATAGTDAVIDQNVANLSDGNVDSIFDMEFVINDLSLEALRKITINNYDVLTNVGTSFDNAAIDPNPLYDFEHSTYYNVSTNKAIKELEIVNQGGVDFVLKLTLTPGNYSKIIINPFIFENKIATLKAALVVSETETSTEIHNFIAKTAKIALEDQVVIPIIGTNINKLILIFNQTSAYPMRYALQRKLLVSQEETQIVRNYLTDK